MRTRMVPRLVSGVIVAGLLTTILSTVPSDGGLAEALATEDDLGCGTSLVEKKLSSGTSWRMCVRIDPIKGLLLEKVEVRPPRSSEFLGFKRVLDGIYLSQLNVPYDNGASAYNDITEYGFGGRYLLAQSRDTCNGELIPVEQAYIVGGRLVERTVDGICVREVNSGLGAHLQDGSDDAAARFASPAVALEISSLSKIGWYEYQQKFSFDSEGKIDVDLGATGDLAPGTPGSPYYSASPSDGWPVGPPLDGVDYFGASHWHSAIYRVDFGIDRGPRQEVEQWDFQRSTGARILGSGQHKVRAFNAVPGEGNDDLTWWRVVNPDSLNADGHARSYEIVNQSPANAVIPVTAPTVSFTNSDPCQEYASDNLNPGCPGESVLDYVSKDDRELIDPVAWINVGFHHVVRDEEQSPMPIHWQGFELVPRDFFAQSPTITEARSCINGPPGFDSSITSKPCVATIITAPRLTTNAVEIKPGVELKVSSGVWNTSRTDWEHTYIWMRNGQPIADSVSTGAMGATYVVRDRDRGSVIAARVTASRFGFPSGSSESNAVTVSGSSPLQAPKVQVRAKLVKRRIKATERAVVKVKVVAKGTDAKGSVLIRAAGRVVARKEVGQSGAATLRLPRLRGPRMGAGTRKYRLRIVFRNPSARLTVRELVTLRVTSGGPSHR